MFRCGDPRPWDFIWSALMSNSHWHQGGSALNYCWSLSYFWNWKPDISQTSYDGFNMTQILLSYAFPLHLVVPGVNKQVVLPLRWNVGNYRQHENYIKKQLFMFLSSTLFLLCDYVHLLKSFSGESYFSSQKDSQVFSSWLQCIKPLLSFPPSPIVFSHKPLTEVVF